MANVTTPIHSGYNIINSTFTGSGSGSLACWMEWKVVSQSAINNTSTIRFYVFIANVANSSGYHVWCNDYDQTNRGSMVVKADGTTVYTRSKRGYATDLIVSAANYTTQYRTAYGSAEGTRFLTIMTDNASSEAAAYGECTVTHASDGTKSVTLSWEADCSFTSSLQQVTGSATVALPAIDRSAPTVTLRTSNLTATGVTLTALSSVTADRWEYKLNSGSWTQFSTQEASSASVTLTTLSPNTTYTVQVRARRALNQVYGTSSTASVTTIGGAVLTNAASIFVNGDSPRVNVTMMVYNPSYTHTLVVKKGTTELFRFTGISVGNAGSLTKTFELTTAQVTTLMNAMPTSSSVTLTYELISYDGSSSVGSTTITGQAVVTSAAAPTLGAFTYQDSNNAVVTVTGDSSVLVQGKSTLQIVSAVASAAQGTTIVKYSATIGDITVESSTRTITFGALAESGTLTVTVTATDARGYSARVTGTITVIAYQPILLESWSMGRQNNVEAAVDAAFSGSISSIMVGGTEKNTITAATYSYKRSSSADYGATTAIAGITRSGTTFSYSGTLLSLNQDYSYHVKITISDAFTSSSIVVYVDKGRPLVAFRSERVGINTNSPQSTLDVDGEIRMNGFPVMGIQSVSMPATLNLNDVTTQGIYFARFDAGTLANNYPVTDYGMLEVFAPSVSMVYQRFTPRATPATIYVRTLVNGTWSAWSSNS